MKAHKHPSAAQLKILKALAEGQELSFGWRSQDLKSSGGQFTVKRLQADALCDRGWVSRERRDSLLFYEITSAGHDAIKRGVRVSNTRAEWPCCGREPGYHGRPSNEAFCSSCQKLLDDARAVRETELDGDLQLFGLGYFAIRTQVIDRELESAIKDLIDLCAVPSNRTDDFDQWVLENMASSREGKWRADRVMMKPEVVHVIRRVVTAVETACKNALARGYSEGSSMIERLSDGSVSVKDFYDKKERIER